MRSRVSEAWPLPEKVSTVNGHNGYCDRSLRIVPGQTISGIKNIHWGCGLCAQECPRGAIDMVAEPA